MVIQYFMKPKFLEKITEKIRYYDWGVRINNISKIRFVSFCFELTFLVKNFLCFEMQAISFRFTLETKP